MGQQQLLLIILGVIVVGIAVVVGITMFRDNAVNANIDAVTNDLVNLGARAQQYFRRPPELGGGGNSFVGLTADPAGIAKLTSEPSNANGEYSIAVAGDQTRVILRGLGRETVNDRRVEVACTVYAGRIGTGVIHPPR